MTRKTDIAEDFKSLLPHLAGHEGESDPDLEFLWVYEPPEHQGEHGKIHLVNRETDHPAHIPHLQDIATHVHHPDRRQGYAYSIQGGWRITDDDHKSIKDDPYLEHLILKALRGEVPPPPLPHVRYHGDPGEPPVDHAL